MTDTIKRRRGRKTRKRNIDQKVRTEQKRQKDIKDKQRKSKQQGDKRGQRRKRGPESPSKFAVRLEIGAIFQELWW